MLPEPQHCPALRPQHVISVSITLLIRYYFLAPPICVGLRPGSVLRAAVPETSIDEDRNFGTDKRDVSSTASAWQFDIDSVTQAVGP